MNEKRGRPESSLSLIRTIRTAMSLTAQQLAELAGTDYYAIQRIEANRNIGPERVYKIAKALNISPDIIFYNMGQLPEDKIEFIKKDPIFFKELIDEACAEPWRLTKTKDYIQDIKDKMEQTRINPEIKKILSRLNKD